MCMQTSMCMHISNREIVTRTWRPVCMHMSTDVHAHVNRCACTYRCACKYHRDMCMHIGDVPAKSLTDVHANISPGFPVRYVCATRRCACTSVDVHANIEQGSYHVLHRKNAKNSHIGDVHAHIQNLNMCMHIENMCMHIGCHVHAHAICACTSRVCMHITNNRDSPRVPRGSRG
jgi:hypothetical protein